MTDNRTAAPVAEPALEAVPAAVWRVAGVVVFGAVMSMLDTSLVNVGLNTIATDLGATLDSAQWIASGYLLALAVALPLVGWLGRRFGLDRVWLGALIGFTITSGLCALAPNMGWLIALRIAQGLTAGLLVPAGQAMIGQVAGPHRLGRVMSVVGIAVVAAPAIGPTVGGLMLAQLPWEWLFLINIPFGLVAVTLALRVLPRIERSAAGTFDVVGFALIGAGLSLLVYGLGEIGSRGDFFAPTVGAPIVLGVLALAGYVLRSVRGRGPRLLDVSMFRSPVFSSANAANLFNGASLFGSMLLLPLYFQVLHGQSLIVTGLSLASFGFGGVVALPIAGRLTDRYGGGVVATIGNVLSVLVTVPFAFGDASMNIVVVQVLLLIRGIGTGLTGIPVVAAAYAAVRRDQLSDAASTVNILQRVGGSIGAALLAVVLYRSAAAGLPLDAGFRQAFWWLTGATVVSLAASIWLWYTEIRLRAARVEPGA
ncbi:EmrB/QacA subfamily drug resistance transporter [Nocardia tenerifensis]|uniref:EmrB/QacA subfamily drug resistance transporter n=1 Tax=Nocardia tenerifensis TaxID=228006 RepID=A0A318K6N9_9NOCA|nr:DHA2 family efflux MFS transporter permease subunit [Nocardia tenerifensis]PXX65196.1 EmrB/QacA subfamily drug resistance transporter [Nocardia tenerifensis]